MKGGNSANKKQKPIMTREQAAETRPCVGTKYARIAIGNLEQIKGNDEERTEAFEMVKGWISENEI